VNDHSGSFILGADHLSFQQTVRRMARAEFADGYLERARSTAFPRQELKKLGAAGLTGLCVPEELGGQGADLIALGLACEEVSYADPNCGYLVFGANIAAGLLAANGTPGAVGRWLPALLAGESVCAIALTEPECGSDAAALTTRARRVTGGWRRPGEKTSVTQAPHADLAIVLARTGPGDQGGQQEGQQRAASRTRGIGAFLVGTADPSVSVQSFRDPGFVPLGRGSITMDDTFVPDEGVLGPVGGGFALIMTEFDLTRTLIAMLCVGAARRALDAAVAYSRQRTSFGKPLSAYQGVSFPIAEHHTFLTAVRTLALHTLGLRMAGQPHTAQAAMLKWWAPQACCDAIRDAIVLHGQVGWSDEMPLQALLRDVSGYLIGDGTPQIQKLIIARELIGREVLDR
jgi:cyclohexanecarboxyl-CoA dehydrogenase